LSFVRKITDAIVHEIKVILREYVNETEAALKKRLRKLLIIGAVISILTALVIAFLGSASLFILIGTLKYLETSMPAWKAWDIVGLTSGVIAVLLLLMLVIFIRKQLNSD